MELAAARQEGFVSTQVSKAKTPPKKRPLVMIGVLTGFGRKNNREVIRKAWMATGVALKKMKDQKGVIARFVIGRSANRGDRLDRGKEILFFLYSIKSERGFMERVVAHAGRVWPSASLFPHSHLDFFLRNLFFLFA